jgi:hypothetical protein
MVDIPPTKPRRSYDTTQARRQAKRREQFNRMRRALQMVLESTSLEQARAAASDGLDTDFSAQSPK